jgi:transcriptional regulator with XRE-family HTH domain
MNEVALHSRSARIGRTLKAYREKTGRHQAVVANAAGISTSMLSQIERGVVSPSIDTLFEVCAALGVEIADFFARVSPRSPVQVHHNGQRLRTEAGGVRYERLVTSPDMTYPAEMLLLEVAKTRRVGMSGGNQEGVELGYVLEGEAQLTVGGERYVVREGDSVSFAAQLPHTLENTGNKPFRAVWCTLPPHQEYLDTATEPA